jgi:hypothetical protein
VARLTFRVLARGTAKIGFASAQALDGALRPVLPLRTAPSVVEVRPDRQPSRRREG